MALTSCYTTGDFRLSYSWGRRKGGLASVGGRMQGGPLAWVSCSWQRFWRRAVSPGGPKLFPVVSLGLRLYDCKRRGGRESLRIISEKRRFRRPSYATGLRLRVCATGVIGRRFSCPVSGEAGGRLRLVPRLRALAAGCGRLGCPNVTLTFGSGSPGCPNVGFTFGSGSLGWPNVTFTFGSRSLRRPNVTFTFGPGSLGRPNVTFTFGPRSLRRPNVTFTFECRRARSRWVSPFFALRQP